MTQKKKRTILICTTVLAIAVCVAGIGLAAQQSGSNISTQNEQNETAKTKDAQAVTEREATTEPEEVYGATFYVATDAMPYEMAGEKTREENTETEPSSIDGNFWIDGEKNAVRTSVVEGVEGVETTSSEQQQPVSVLPRPTAETETTKVVEKEINLEKTLGVSVSDLEIPEYTQTVGKSILFGGGGNIKIEANSTAQSFSYQTFKNNEKNPCFLEYSMCLQDTGEIIYTSGLVPPGYQITEFEFTRALPEGDYPVTIKTAAYSFDTEMRQINNFAVKTTLCASVSA